MPEFFDAEDLVSERNLFIASRAEIEENMETLFAARSKIFQWADEWKTYYSNTITPTRIAEWILQHTRPELVRTALHVLSNVFFVSDVEVSRSLRELISQLPEPVRGARFYQPGSIQDSSGVVAYTFAKALGLSEKVLAERVIKTLTELKPTDTALILLDDNIASGTQTVDTLKSWMGMPTSGEIDPVELSEEVRDRLRAVDIYWLFAVALGDGPELVETYAAELGLRVHVHCARRIGRDALTGLDFASRSRAVLQIASIGRILNSAKTAWKPERRLENALGHGNLMQCTVFAHNAPKNLTTSLWRFAHHRLGMWLPLFPEREVWRENSLSIESGNPYQRHLAQLVLEGRTPRKASALRIGWLFDHCTTSGSAVEADAGEVESLYSELVPRWLNRLVPDPMSVALQQSIGGVHFRRMQEALGYKQVTPQQIERYNERIIQYDSEVADYGRRLLSELDDLSRVFSLELTIDNSGTAVATDIIVELDLPDGVTKATGRYLSSPPDPPAEPRPEGPNEEMMRTMKELSRRVMLPSSLLLDELRTRSESEPFEVFGADGAVVQLRWRIAKLRQETGLRLSCPDLLFAGPSTFLFRWGVHCVEMPQWERGEWTVTLSRGERTRPEVKEALELLIGSRKPSED